MIITLLAVCVVAAGGLAVTYAATRDQIAKQKKIDEAKAYSEALPAVKNANDFARLDTVVNKAKRKYPDLLSVVKGRVGGDVAGYVVVVGPRGYGGPVQMAVGLTPDGKITGIAFIANGNNETQGLGTQALQPAYTKELVGKSSRDPIEIGKDVDAITGATRSSKAVVTGTKEATMIFKDYIRGGK